VLQQKDDEELLYYLLQLVQVGGRRATPKLLDEAWTQQRSHHMCYGISRTPLKPHPWPQTATTTTTTHPSPSSTANALVSFPQALRFEAVDLSRLARFLIVRATANPAFATYLHW
jgi:hypothetical protein